MVFSSSLKPWNSVPLSTVRVRAGRGEDRMSWVARRFVAATVRERSFPTMRYPVFAIGEGEKAVGVSGGSHHGVALEVADTAAVVSSGRSIWDGSFPGETPSGIVCAVTFSALLESLSEVGVKRASAATVLPDEAVDGLVADGEDPFALESARDLLWAPVLMETGDDQDPIGEAELGVASGARSSPSGEVMGQDRAVATVFPGVAAHLAADGAGVAAESAGDGGLREALFRESGEFLPLLRGELAVTPHETLPLLGR